MRANNSNQSTNREAMKEREGSRKHDRKQDDKRFARLYEEAYIYQMGLPRPFSAKGNLVTLSGKAENSSAKELAAKFVKDVHGVKSVKNQMTIEESK